MPFFPRKTSNNSPSEFSADDFNSYFMEKTETIRRELPHLQTNKSINLPASLSIYPVTKEEVHIPVRPVLPIVHRTSSTVSYSSILLQQLRPLSLSDVTNFSFHQYAEGPFPSAYKDATKSPPLNKQKTP